MEDLLNNPLAVAIIGGTISTFLGGLLLLWLPTAKKRSERGGDAQNHDRESCLVMIFRLSLLSLANAVMIGLLFGTLTADALDFGIPGLSVFIKIGLIVFADCLIVAKLFYHVELIS